jgi:hypothetical protein
MLLGDTINLRKQFFNLIVLEPNHLPQAIELNTEDFLLILLIVLKVFNIKVNHFLELVLHPLQLLILLLHVIVIRLLSLNENTFQPADLLVLLFANLVHALVDNVFYGLLLFERLFQLVDLVLHVLFALLVLGADLLLVELDCLVRTNALVLEVDFGLVLEVLVTLFPGGDLLHEVGLFEGEVLEVGGLLFENQFELFIERLQHVDFFSPGVVISLQVSKLLEEQLVLELKILCALEFNPEPAELILRDGELVFQPADFALVVVEVVFGRVALVHALLELVLEFDLCGHLGALGMWVV